MPSNPGLMVKKDSVPQSLPRSCAGRASVDPSCLGRHPRLSHRGGPRRLATLRATSPSTPTAASCCRDPLPWRQQEIRLNQLFPQRTDLITAVIDATTPEAADEAAEALVSALANRTDVIRNIGRPDGGEFFARDGEVLFLSVDDVRRNMDELIKAEPFLGTLAADPTRARDPRHAVSQSLEGVRLKKTTLEKILNPRLSRSLTLWIGLSRGCTPPSPGANLAFWASRAGVRRISAASSTSSPSSITAPSRSSPGAMEAWRPRPGPGDHRQTGPDAGQGASLVRLTGSVPPSGRGISPPSPTALQLNGVVMILVVLLILWLALKQARIMLAVLINLAIGLSFTAAVGLWMVGKLNLISIAFAILFVGLGVDFGIQFSVRYRAERFADRDLLEALETTGRRVAAPLLLAAASIAAAFYSFLPTDYVGLSELGLIAGTGMIVAFLTTVTLLPALLSVLKPAGEAAPVGWAWLAPLDHFLDKRRNWVVGLTLAAVVLGLPLLRGLSFDFNPLNLRSRHVESVSTLLDLMRDPDTSPNTIDVLAPDLASASAMAEKLKQLPEVAKVRTLESFVPKDQDEKLAIIDDASFFFANTLNPDPVDPAPTPAQTLEAINKTAADLSTTAGNMDAPAAAQARRLANALTALAKASPSTRDEAERVLVTPLVTMLRQVRELLTAEHVTIDTLPPSLKSAWVAANGEVRIEARPNGDGNDNAVLHRFVDAVRKVAPQASGGPVFIVEAAATIVKAFLEAAVWSLLSISLILFVALRRWRDVALTLVPLLVAIIVTLEICVAIGLKLNFANIIALPLLLGVGVAFKIYYVMAFRAGENNFLQS